MIKKKYTAPSCYVIEVGITQIMAGSDKGNITINKEPYEGELPSKKENPNIWDEGGDGSLWDEY